MPYNFSAARRAFFSLSLSVFWHKTRPTLPPPPPHRAIGNSATRYPNPILAALFDPGISAPATLIPRQFLFAISSGLPIFHSATLSYCANGVVGSAMPVVTT